MKINEQEVVRSYVTAKERGKQVKILAELNCCSKEDIMDILKRNGVEVNNRIFNGGNHKNPMKTSVSNVKPEAPKAESEKVIKTDDTPKEGFLQEKPKEKADNQVEPEADTKADTVAESEYEIVPVSVIELVENEIHNLHKINNDLLKRVQENITTLRELEGFLDSHKADE